MFVNVNVTFKYVLCANHSLTQHLTSWSLKQEINIALDVIKLTNMTSIIITTCSPNFHKIEFIISLSCPE